jgi:hypothetical protein
MATISIAARILHTINLLMNLTIFTGQGALINSELFSCVGKMCEIKAPIAGKTQSNRCAHGASFSKAIAKIGNAELAHFTKQMLIHELIRGSLDD